MFRTKINWDALGVGTSLACAIHCAILPLLVSTLPFFGVDFIQNKLFEYSMIAIAFLIGVFSLSHGYRKHHRQLYPILIFTVGFSFLLGKELIKGMEIPFLIIAVVLIITAHWANYKRSKKVEHAHADTCVH